MLQAPVQPSIEDAGRREKWDSFLDAYSTYLRDPSLVNAAALHLAGAAVASNDASFSLEAFEARLGWSMALDQ
jgi:hypothetical protein